VEGDPISVTADLVLPAQPTSGTTTYIPLGGDGFTSPIAAYAVNAFALTGDASSGTATQTVTLDDRYCGLVSFVSFNIAQGTPADADFRAFINSSTGFSIPQIMDAGVVTAIAAAFGLEINHTWNCPPVMLAGGTDVGRITLAVENVLSDVMKLFTLIYIFDIRVRETTPMGPLLWARGAT